MPNKNIYLSDVLYAKLSLEREPSKLVQNLLIKHYKESDKDDNKQRNTK